MRLVEPRILSCLVLLFLLSYRSHEARRASHSLVPCTSLISLYSVTVFLRLVEPRLLVCLVLLFLFSSRFPEARRASPSLMPCTSLISFYSVPHFSEVRRASSSRVPCTSLISFYSVTVFMRPLSFFCIDRLSCIYVQNSYTLSLFLSHCVLHAFP
jgi:hypothetical protein